ncbi:GNAT family N-acetyltransferase [Microbacterium sp. NIBRBAC000506063]|uniref:GNAT family N-acetyltransferase n=1 Tax=Microbacterium sp. NIBRBAC000506063 TaxID=2734618 RepID=UPI001BB5A048|nr:GNAT family N-acetyltransferase [Microbacterium sp. NIBRBAC000506063]QTV79653.1 GNAT family N-acetyltransferase [Microbacterium sp. NIBRBAC000506063]
MISVEPLSDLDALRRLHRTLLAPSFRPNELLPEDDFISQFGHDAEALVARDASGAVLGLAVSEIATPVVLLQYLVAAPGTRGRGVGSALLSAVLDRWSSDAGVEVLLAEFDRPDVQSSHPIYGDPEARLRFYARFGALALDLPYFQPPVSPDAEREHGMLLAVFDADGAGERRGRLTPEQSAAVHGYLATALTDAADADAQRLLAAAEAPAGIVVRALDRYQEVPLSRPPR